MDRGGRRLRDLRDAPLALVLVVGLVALAAGAVAERRSSPKLCRVQVLDTWVETICE